MYVSSPGMTGYKINRLLDYQHCIPLTFAIHHCKEGWYSLRVDSEEELPQLLVPGKSFSVLNILYITKPFPRQCI